MLQRIKGISVCPNDRAHGISAATFQIRQKLKKAPKSHHDKRPSDWTNRLRQTRCHLVYNNLHTWQQIKTMKRSTVAKHIFPSQTSEEIYFHVFIVLISETHRFLWKMMRNQNKIICQNHEKASVWAGILTDSCTVLLPIEKDVNTTYCTNLISHEKGKYFRPIRWLAKHGSEIMWLVSKSEHGPYAIHISNFKHNFSYHGCLCMHDIQWSSASISVTTLTSTVAKWRRDAS